MSSTKVLVPIGRIRQHVGAFGKAGFAYGFCA